MAQDIRTQFIALRKGKQFSKIELSRRTGICRNTISLYEKGQQEMAIGLAEKLVKYMGGELIIKL